MIVMSLSTSNISEQMTSDIEFCKTFFIRTRHTKLSETGFCFFQIVFIDTGKNFAWEQSKAREI